MIHDFEIEVDRLDRHLTILQKIVEMEPIGIVRLSDETGFPDHKVRYSLRVLEKDRLIEPSADGAITTEETAEFLETHREEIDQIIDRIENIRLNQLSSD